MRVLRLIRVFLALPFEIKKRVTTYYVNRIIHATPSDHQTIWTSFFYFAGRQGVTVIDAGENFEVQFDCQGKVITTLIRKGSSTDIFAFFQIFIAEGYKPLFELLEKKSFSPSTVIDAGANVGYFTQLLTCYESPLTLVALEPERENFVQLKKNLSQRSVNIVESAIWIETKELFLEKHVKGDWSVKVTEQGTGPSCQAMSLKDVLSVYGIRKVGLLKLDVEGTEDVLFRNQSFLNELENVNVIAMEIHEHMADKNMILSELTKRQFKYFREGELTVAWKGI